MLQVPTPSTLPHTWTLKWVYKELGSATIEVHFKDGVPHPTTLQAKGVPLQLGNWTGKVDLLVSTLGRMDCILGMEFITQNNVLIEGHNRLVRIPSKSGIVRVRAHELPCVGGPTIHFMLGKAWERECVGGFGMMCVMWVLDEYEPKEATKMVTSAKCIKQVLEEFPCRNPTLVKCEDETHTPKVEDLESFGTLECLEFDSRGQNTSYWGVFGVIGKVLKCKCPKWPRIGHLDICNPSYGQKKGQESNWQFDSRPLNVGNRPFPDVGR